MTENDVEYEQFKRGVLGEDASPAEEAETPVEGHGFDGDHTSVAWASEPSAAVREGEQVKDALLSESYEDHFGGDHPSDHLSDEQIWSELPESFHPHGEAR